MGLTVTTGAAQDLGARHNQQDAFGSIETADGGLLAVVADGMGGLESGEAASKAAVDAMLHTFQTRTPDESVAGALRRCVYAANEAVCGIPADTGTTLVAVHVRGTELSWISVGDSAIFLERGGSLVKLNMAHNYAS